MWIKRGHACKVLSIIPGTQQLLKLYELLLLLFILLLLLPPPLPVEGLVVHRMALKSNFRNGGGEWDYEASFFFFLRHHVFCTK